MLKPPNTSSFFKKKLFIYLGYTIWTSLVAQTVKRLPAMRETWVRSLGREDPLEKEMATHSSILASLVVQGLGVCTFTTGGMGSIPVQGIKTLPAA